MMKSKYKSLKQRIFLLLVILVFLFLAFSFNAVLVKGSETSSTSETTSSQQTTPQQPCICPKLEQNYSACLVDLIKINASLQSCMNVTYYSVVNQLYQEINNINNKVTYVSIGIGLSIVISILTLFKAEIVVLFNKIKKWFKRESEGYTI